METEQRVQSSQSKARPRVKKPVFKRQFQPGYQGAPSQITDKTDTVQPDEALTVRELLFNHARGVDINDQLRQGVYLDDLEVPVITDLTDLQSHRDELERRLAELKDQITEERNRAAETADLPPDGTKVPPDKEKALGEDE